MEYFKSFDDFVNESKLNEDTDKLESTWDKFLKIEDKYLSSAEYDAKKILGRNGANSLWANWNLKRTGMFAISKMLQYTTKDKLKEFLSKYVNEHVVNESEFPYHFISQNFSNLSIGKFDGQDAILFTSNSLSFELNGGRKGPGLKQLDRTIKFADADIKYALDKSNPPKGIAIYGDREELLKWAEAAYINHPADSTKKIGAPLIKKLK